MKLSRWPWWALAAAGLATLGAEFALPDPPGVVESAGAPAAPHSSSAANGLRDQQDVRATLRSLLASPLVSEALPAAEQDPFASPRAAQIPASIVVTPPTAPAPPPLAPAPTPQAPPMTHRYFGSMQDPDGVTRYYLTDGERAVAARDGALLSSGYVVEAVNEREIRLAYPATAVSAIVAITSVPRP